MMLVSLAALMVMSSISEVDFASFQQFLFSLLCLYQRSSSQPVWVVYHTKHGHAVLAILLPCINSRWKVAAISSIHKTCPYNFAHLQGQDFWFDQEVRIAFGQTVVWCFLSLSWMECTPALRLCVQCACLATDCKGVLTYGKDVTLEIFGELVEGAS